MSETNRVNLEVRPLGAVLGTLDDEFGSYSIEEIRTLSGPALARELARAGLAVDDTDPVDDAAWCKKIDAAVAEAPPVVERPNLVREITDVATGHTTIAVTGAAGSGKTMVLQRLLPAHNYARARLPRIIRIDCAALRMTDHKQFSKNATWAIFGPDDEAFRRFTFVCRNHNKDPLLTLLEHRLAGGGLFILDHMEHVNRCESIDHFLFEQLLPLAQKVGFSVAFCDRSIASLQKFRRFAKCETREVRVENINRDEIRGWLDTAFFARIDGFSMTASDVLEVTGGSPRLIRDLANFIELDRHADGMTIEKFGRYRPREYVAHCERLMWARRTLPVLLTSDLEKLAVADLPEKERGHIRETLCATGVVSEKEGRFAYISPIHRDRINFLSKPEVLSLALLRAASPAALASRSHQVRLWDCAEIAVDPLTQFLTSERCARLALQKLRGILHNWGFKATLYLRDRNNARLFLELDQNGDRIFPLDDAEFIRAVQTGRSLITGDGGGNPGELLVPVIGYTGTVEMLFKGSFCAAPTARYLRDIRRDRFVNLLRGLKPALSQVLERFWAGRDRLLGEKLMYATKKTPERGSVWQNMLEALSSRQPAALVVLYRPQKRWKVASFERVGRSEEDDALIFASEVWAEPADSRRLDTIAVHPSEHGLVLSNQDAKSIFPLLADHKDAAVYVRPVRFNNDRRLVVFMFKRAPAGGLDGKVQQRLWMAAPAIAAIS